MAGSACKKAPAGQASPASGSAAAPAPAGGTTPGTPATAAPGSAAAPATTPATTPPTPPEPPAAAVPAQLPQVLAHVNSENVTRSEFERLLANIELNNGPVPPARRDELYRKILEELVTYTVLRQEAKARNFTATDAEIDAQMQTLKQQAGTEENFKKALAARKMTLDRLKSDARVELSIAKMMNAQVASAPEATDAECQDFYNKNPDRFNRPESVRASHILLLVPATADEAAKKDARTKLEGVLKRAKGGEDFAALAQQNSQDGSAQQGGDLGYFPREKMVKEFSDVAFALKVGDISDIVTTQFGLHVIKVTDRKAAGTVPLAEVSPRSSVT